MRALLLFPVALGQAQDSAALRLVQTIPMPGVQGRIDHLAADLNGHRLFVAALGNNTLEVLDLRAGKRTHTVRGLHEPQGVAYVAALNRIFVANGEDGKCRIFDGSTLQPVAEADFSKDADNVRYDPAAKHLWVGYGAGALGELEAATAKRLGDVQLEAHPESFQLERNGPRIFVNVPNGRHVAVIDRHRHAIMTKWPVREAEANFPMALDEANRRLFLGCRKPARVLVLDTATGKLVTHFACAGDTDDLFYDAAHKWIYVSGGEGYVSVVEQKDADHYQPLPGIRTAPGARTSLFVPDWKRLYVAVPHRGNLEAEIRVYEAASR